jgi:hypothetical protein
MRRHLYKYFTERKWAEAFLAEGSMHFSSLGYFRDYEDAQTRGDRNEGTAILRPVGGLRVTNRTRGGNYVVSGVEFDAKAGEIFVYCASRSENEEKRERFNAVVCVEIFDAKAFCRRVQKALPWKASFGGRPGHERLGHHVEYHKVTDDINPRWACPDLIGISKLDSYQWQDEFRLLFSLTDALRFENITGRLIIGDAPRRVANPTEHNFYDLKIGGLGDIAILHKFPVSLSA